MYGSTKTLSNKSKPEKEEQSQRYHPFDLKFLLQSHSNQRASQLAQCLKKLPAVQEMWVQFLGQEDPLEEGTATHSTILAWRIPWTEEPGWLQCLGHKESDTTQTEATELSTTL